MLKVVNAAIPNLFENVRGFNPNTHIDEADIMFVESKVEN